MAEKSPLKKTKGKADEFFDKKPYRPKPLTEEEKRKLREEFRRQQKPYRYSDGAFKDMTDEEKRRMIYLTKERHRDPGAEERMMEFERSLRAEGLDNSKMKDGGMARGKGGKMYQHNYATGGSVTDHLQQKKGKK